MPTDWLWGPDYTLAREVVGRGIAVLYLIGFLVAARQFRPLLGERGLQPVPDYLRRTPFRQSPSLFHLHYSDRALQAVAWSGAVLSALLVIGLPQAAPLPVTMLAWLLVWVLYLSIVNVGQTFYSFGWETLLLEAGFLAVFLGNHETAPPLVTLFLFRWLAFRVEFGAGLIKMRGDPCWRNLTCLHYHHETQPMPNPLSWYFHRLPRRFHQTEVLGNHVAQLVAPFLLFAPQPVAALAAIYMVGTQLYLVVSGNYAWLNWITIIILAAALPNVLFGGLVGTPTDLQQPGWFAVTCIGLALVVAYLSYWPVRNMIGPRQLMNYSFNALRLVNTYGAFGSVTRTRYEVVIEGRTDDAGATWREYEFKGKPGDPIRRPPQVAPYHLRLDWLMWFLPISRAYGEGWFPRFIERLLENDPQILGLLRSNPFPDRPPAVIRARLYRYRFTTWRERRETGAWWVREPVGNFLPPVSLRAGSSMPA